MVVVFQVFGLQLQRFLGLQLQLDRVLWVSMIVANVGFFGGQGMSVFFFNRILSGGFSEFLDVFVFNLGLLR